MGTHILGVEGRASADDAFHELGVRHESVLYRRLAQAEHQQPDRTKLGLDDVAADWATARVPPRAVRLLQTSDAHQHVPHVRARCCEGCGAYPNSGCEEHERALQAGHEWPHGRQQIDRRVLLDNLVEVSDAPFGRGAVDTYIPRQSLGCCPEGRCSTCSSVKPSNIGQQWDGLTYQSCDCCRLRPPAHGSCSRVAPSAQRSRAGCPLGPVRFAGTGWLAGTDQPDRAGSPRRLARRRPLRTASWAQECGFSGWSGTWVQKPFASRDVWRDTRVESRLATPASLQARGVTSEMCGALLHRRASASRGEIHECNQCWKCQCGFEIGQAQTNSNEQGQGVDSNCGDPTTGHRGHERKREPCARARQHTRPIVRRPGGASSGSCPA